MYPVLTTSCNQHNTVTPRHPSLVYVKKARQLFCMGLSGQDWSWYFSLSESQKKPSLDGLRPEMSENYVHVDRAFLIAMPVLFLGKSRIVTPHPVTAWYFSVFNITYWATFGSHFFSWWQLPQLIQTWVNVRTMARTFMLLFIVKYELSLIMK